MRYLLIVFITFFLNTGFSETNSFNKESEFAVNVFGGYVYLPNRFVLNTNASIKVIAKYISSPIYSEESGVDKNNYTFGEVLIDRVVNCDICINKVDSERISVESVLGYEKINVKMVKLVQSGKFFIIAYDDKIYIMIDDDGGWQNKLRYFKN